MPAGEFSPSALLDIKLKAEQIWSDSRLAQDFKAKADSAKAVLENQTATFRELDNPEKDNQVVVNFINPCAIVAEDCESNCDITGDELETGGKTYTLDLCKKADFSVNAEKLRTNTYSVEEVSARGLASALKALDEYWARQVLVKLKAFAGVNVAPAPWTWAAGTTSVPAAQYTFMVAPSAVAMKTKTRNPDVPTLIAGTVQQTRYTIASPNLPGVKYDVYYTLTCKTINGKANIVHSWRIETNGGIFLNPEGCPVVIGGTTYTPTGVISYSAV
jgi:hypothetical protein